MGIFDDLVGTLQPAMEWDERITGALQTFATQLNAQDNVIVRLWVDDAVGYGHQTSSVRILRQLANPTAENGFAYAGGIEVYYANQSGGNLTKLEQLLPELTDGTGRIANATVTLIKWVPLQNAPTPVCRFGFTGGADNGGEEHDIPVNFAARLNTTNFLRLQPYRWVEAPDELQFLVQGKPAIQLDEQDVLGNAGFKQRAYYNPPYLEPEWTSYSGEVATQAAVAKWLTSELGGLAFVPIYSIRTTTDSQVVYPAQSMFNVLAGLLASQGNGKVVRQGAKSIIAVSCDRFVDAKVQADLLAIFNRTYEDPNDLFDDEGEPLEGQEAEDTIAKSQKARNDYLLQADAINRVKFIFDTQAGSLLSQIEAQVSWLSACNDRLLFVQLGRTPAAIFNYLLQMTTLPIVFEGQNTANAVIGLGKPYLHFASSYGDAVFHYPTTLLSYREPDLGEQDVPGQLAVGAVPLKMQLRANQIVYSFNDWQAGSTKNDDKPDGNPAEFLGNFIAGYPAASGMVDYRAYFEKMGTFYSNPANDKFRIAVAVLAVVAGQTQTLSDAEGRALPGADTPLDLDTLLTALQANLSASGVLAVVPGAISSGPIFAFFKGLGTGAAFTVTGAVVTPQRDAAGALVAIHVTGTSDLFGPALATTVDFALSLGRVEARIRMTGTDSWNPPQIPWLVFKNPFVEIVTYDATLPTVGSIGGTISGADVELSLALPIVDGTWRIQGVFEAPYPSVAKFYAMAGGVNLMQSLPGPLATLSGIGVSQAWIAFDTSKNRVEYVGVTARTQSGLRLLPGLDVTSTVLSLTVIDPQGARSVVWSVRCRVKVGTAPDGGVLMLGANGPGLTLSGQLVSGTITLTDILSIFLGDAVFEPTHQPSITALSVTVTPATGDYTFSCNLNIDETISVGGRSLTLAGVGISATRIGQSFLGGLTASLKIGSGATAPVMQLVASYATKTSWTYFGTQTSGTISLTDLFNQFLPTDWAIQSEYAIAGLAFRYATKDGSWSIAGKTAEPWTVPFIDDLTVSASLKAGYVAPKPPAPPEARAIPAKARSVPALARDLSLTEGVARAMLPEASDDPKPGYFARLETDWTWEFIKLKVFFDYAPDKQQYGITWGVLTGLVSGPDPKTQDYTATLRFTAGVSLGSIVEQMVSWATGSQFGLASPWNALNAVSLDRLALVYVFNKTDSTRNNVSLDIAIGPIELGFCRIDSIALSYQSTDTATSEKGVLVAIKGSFRWQSDPSTPLAWDATKPETTPAPPGNGNKYIDLRLLALGQHVTVPGFSAATSVMAAIDELKKFPDTKPGQLPGIEFDPGSGWLVGMDFGLLKIGGDGGNAPATAADSGGYVVSLQVVFNDPNLYALRLALAGTAAKVFQGLDFQIMYRRVSDTVGVYQVEITLPDIMRHLSVGAYTITLPVFAIQVYTNGDFLIDIGFPWNADFARSFSIEALIPPGIPVLGSAGFYFGKLSSASTNKVPAATNGTFNPVIVFGFGLQVGFGKSIAYGVLKAGFSVTIVGIIEGVIAKWNPYQITNSGGQPSSQVQGDYYFWLRGTVGIVGQVYGSVDFAVIKADVNVTVKLLLQLTYESFVSITISVIASVDISVSVKINLGLFKITLHFSFSMRLKETFEIANNGTSPWQVAQSQKPMGLLRRTPMQRLRPRDLRQINLRQLNLRQMSQTAPSWGNLLPAATPAVLAGYAAPALAMARDEWDTTPNLAAQVPCYVALLLLQSTPPAGADGDASLRKAVGAAADTAFEVLAKAVLRWVVAAIQDGPLTSSEVDALTIDGGDLERLASEILVSTDATPVPLSLAAIDAFLAGQVRVELVLPPTDQDVSVDATVFPVPPQLALTIPAYGSGYPGVAYGFGTYNALGDDVLAELRHYFDELAVKVQQEIPPAPRAAATPPTPLSMAGWVLSDYVLLIARQMVKAAQEALRDFTWPIAAGDTGATIVDWVNTHADLQGDDAFTLHDLFSANQTHPLAAARRLTIGMTDAGATSFTEIAAQLAPGVTATSLARANAATSGLFVAGAIVTLPEKPDYAVLATDTLISVAAHFAVSLSDLLARSNVLTATDLLAATGVLVLPRVAASVQTGDSFTTIAEAAVWAGGFDAAALATANAGEAVLRPAVQLIVGTRQYIVLPGDSLGDVANGLGLTLAQLLTDTDVVTGTGYLVAGARLVVPVFGYATAAGETLQAIAERFGIDVAVLGDQPANGAIADLFALTESNPDRTPAPTLDLPHLPRLPVGEILKEAQRSGAIQHLSGMVSRYMLHGLRLPTTGITPNAAGMWVRGSVPMTLPPMAGIYALTGQQFPLPDLVSGQDFTATLDRSAGPDWLQFRNGAGQATDTLSMVVTPGSTDATRITKVAAYARGSRLAVPLDSLGAGEMYHVELASYPLGAATPVQGAGPVAVPYGPAPSGTPVPVLWRLPDQIAALAGPAQWMDAPRFALKTARFDEATGQTVQAPVASYGWATTLQVLVKRVPTVTASNASQATYELVGAGGKDILLLERLVAQVRDDAAIFSLTLGFAPAGAGPDTNGVAIDDATGVTFGLAQVNLSTETRPPSAAARAALATEEETGLGLLNKPTEFLRLVWEASITRSGGFYLYYYDASEKRGLPDRIFNDRNEAELTLIVLYTGRADATRNRIAGFMNAALTVNAVDTSQTAGFAQADPLPVMIGTAQSNLGNLSLAQLATTYHTDVATIARINAEAALGNVPIAVDAGRFQAPPGGIALATIASRFATTVAALQAANSDWGTLPDPLPYPAVIALPPLTLSTTSPNRASLRAIADAYGEPVVAIAEANSTVPGLFQNPITIVQDTLSASSLADLAARSYDDPADVAEANADVPLAGVQLVVGHGTVQAPPGGISVAAVAQTFATTTAALDAANPGWSGGLPATIPYPTAIWLPRLTPTAGGSTTSTLRAIADTYGTDIATLAAENAPVAGLFAGQVVTLPGGPRVRAATVPAGVQAVAASRPSPPAVPVDPNATGFAEAFLLEAFSLLGQKVLDNVDFRASNQGLPAGPTTTRAPAPKPTKVRAAVAEADVETWDFQQSIPYARLTASTRAGVAALPDPARSPYLGVGCLLQVAFDWQDQYGNRLITNLSDPQAGDTGEPNAAPMVTGYTDPLVALGQWPSVGASWRIGGTNAAPELRIALSFDASRYGGLIAARATAATTIAAQFTAALDPTSAADLTRYRLDVNGQPGPVVSAAVLGTDGRTVTLTLATPLAEGPVATLQADAVKQVVTTDPVLGGAAQLVYPDDPALRSSTAQKAALHALATYRALYYQMNDPNGFAMTVGTTLLASAAPVPVPAATVAALEAWLFGPATGSIFAFLADRAEFGTNVPAPATGATITIAIDPQALNPAQIFELESTFTMTRTGGLVLGGLATTSGLVRAATRLAPYHDPAGLGTFAAGLETLLSSTDQALKVATGQNRESSAVAGTEAPLWVVRLGLTASAGISYRIDSPGTDTPVVFAPAPVSNRLQSRPRVLIRPYQTGEGLGTAVPTQFVDIDVDEWCAWTFAAIDKLLTPQFTAPMQILGRFEDRDYLAEILAAKKTIAQAASNLMIPVFKTTGTAPDASAAQAAFLQQLLVELSNTYTTRAAVGVAASVAASVGETTPPRLYGNVVQRSPMLVKAAVTGGSLTSVRLTFSARLDPDAAGVAANYTLSQPSGAAPGIVTAELEPTGDSVLLTTSSDVTIGDTSVTVQNLLDAQKLALRPPLTRTIGAESGPEPVYSLSDAKLPLVSGPGAITYLVSTSAQGSGAEGDTGAALDLDVMFQAAQIEHQIGSVPGITGGYEASTWLGFVLPDGAKMLTADLGQVQVPLVLRAFPATPTMVGQAKAAGAADVTNLEQATRWDYTCTYSLPYHYPQDLIFGEVDFNLQSQMGMRGTLADAFDAFAEFVSAFPAIQKDLLEFLAPIDATTKPPSAAPVGDDSVANAAAALGSVVTLIQGLASATGGSGDGTAVDHGGSLMIRNPTNRLGGNPSLKYDFQVAEGRTTLPNVADELLCVTLTGAVPDGIATPRIDIPGFTAEQVPGTESGTSKWVYKSPASQAYLTEEAGRLIAERTLVLPGLDILQRQDANATVYLTRNAELVKGRPSADPFVYRTPEVGFASPLYPTNDAGVPIDIAQIGAVAPADPVTRSLSNQLVTLFSTLLAENLQPDLTIQVAVTYAYPLNIALQPVELPVFMQAPLRVALTGSPVKIPETMIDDWVTVTEQWFSRLLPKGGGKLWFDLVIMSDLTQQPMPLLRLRELYLELASLDPSPPTAP